MLPDGMQVRASSKVWVAAGSTKTGGGASRTAGGDSHSLAGASYRRVVVLNEKTGLGWFGKTKRLVAELTDKLMGRTGGEETVAAKAAAADRIDAAYGGKPAASDERRDPPSGTSDAAKRVDERKKAEARMFDRIVLRQRQAAEDASVRAGGAWGSVTGGRAEAGTAEAGKASPSLHGRAASVGGLQHKAFQVSAVAGSLAASERAAGQQPLRQGAKDTARPSWRDMLAGRKKPKQTQYTGI